MNKRETQGEIMQVLERLHLSSEFTDLFGSRNKECQCLSFFFFFFKCLSLVQPAGSYCFPGKEMAHSIKISLMTLVLSEQKEQKEEGKKIFL